MSSEQRTAPVDRFLGLPIRSTRVHLDVFGLGVLEIENLIRMAARSGLQVQPGEGESVRWVNISDSAGAKLSIFPSDDFPRFDDYDFTAHVRPSAEVQLQQECGESLAQAGVVNEALS